MRSFKPTSLAPLRWFSIQGTWNSQQQLRIAIKLPINTLKSAAKKRFEIKRPVDKYVTKTETQVYFAFLVTNNSVGVALLGDRVT